MIPGRSADPGGSALATEATNGINISGIKSRIIHTERSRSIASSSFEPISAGRGLGFSFPTKKHSVGILQEYQRWWPGVHLELHNVRHHPGGVGNVVHMDEWVGKRRVKMNCVVTEAEPGARLVWQMSKFVRLPARLVLEFQDDGNGVMIIHTIRAGFQRFGILDALLRMYFSDEFASAMDEHARVEFPKLGDMLASRNF